MQCRADAGQGQYPIADFQIEYSPMEAAVPQRAVSDGYLLDSWQGENHQTANPELENDLQCSCFTAISIFP